MAEYEREIIVERTRAGLQAAKERGKLTGRPIGLSEDAKRKAIAAKRLYENRDYSIDESRSKQMKNKEILNTNIQRGKELIESVTNPEVKKGMKEAL